MDDVVRSLVVVVLLLATNAFFVAAEFALVKARGFRLETVALRGSGAARLTLRIQSRLEAYLAACRLGITMASLGLGWVGEPAAAALLEPLFQWAGVPDTVLHTVAFLAGFLLFSSLHIVVGEHLPMALAIRRAEPVSVWVAWPLHIAYLTVYPLSWLLSALARSILSWFPVDETSRTHGPGGEVIGGQFVTVQRRDEIAGGETAMLRRQFEFDRRQVGRVMLPRADLKVLDITESPEYNLTIIRDSGHSRFPVIDSGNGGEILGMVMAKDLYTAMLCGAREPWKDLRKFCREPLVVPESRTLAYLFDAMRAGRAHMACVVNKYGELAGFVTLEDLLEEFVGLAPS